MERKHFSFFQTAVTGNRTPNSGVKGSGANHYPRTPAQEMTETRQKQPIDEICYSTVQMSTVMNTVFTICSSCPVLSYKLRYILGFGLVEMAISTNQSLRYIITGTRIWELPCKTAIICNYSVLQYTSTTVFGNKTWKLWFRICHVTV